MESLPAKFEARRFIAADGHRSVISGLGADEILAGDPPALSPRPRSDPQPVARARQRVFREILSELAVCRGPARSAHGLSVFAPFLHHRVVAFSSVLPMHMRTDGHLGKLALRSALRQLLPDDIRLQPKVARVLSRSPLLRERAVGLDRVLSSL